MLKKAASAFVPDSIKMVINHKSATVKKQPRRLPPPIAICILSQSNCNHQTWLVLLRALIGPWDQELVRAGRWLATRPAFQNGVPATSEQWACCSAVCQKAEQDTTSCETEEGPGWLGSLGPAPSLGGDRCCCFKRRAVRQAARGGRQSPGAGRRQWVSVEAADWTWVTPWCGLRPQPPVKGEGEEEVRQERDQREERRRAAARAPEQRGLGGRMMNGWKCYVRWLVGWREKGWWWWGWCESVRQQRQAAGSRLRWLAGWLGPFLCLGEKPPLAWLGTHLRRNYQTTQFHRQTNGRAMLVSLNLHLWMLQMIKKKATGNMWLESEIERMEKGEGRVTGLNLLMAVFPPTPTPTTSLNLCQLLPNALSTWLHLSI